MTLSKGSVILQGSGIKRSRIASPGIYHPEINFAGNFYFHFEAARSDSGAMAQYDTWTSGHGSGTKGAKSTSTGTLPKGFRIAEGRVLFGHGGGCVLRKICLL